ncbi:Predicted ABC-type ATPase [Rugamonas rubra]|uniref:Predicted ABC-type ATPase n=1 Tax=Rugamonas rubra TaxID=758825 RepID=A0A1I4SP70_9BURK|nr:zeta toxin family protein [Rugamonas rubra]SFM66232.1 Predicted ABC-type ATPase [Rugamonas rubra]
MLRPQLIFIAGANGSGKSTFREILRRADLTKPPWTYQHLPYLNVDEHYAALLKTDPSTTFAAAITWRNAQISTFINNKQSFIVETLLDEGKLGYIKSARKRGFETTIYFLGLASSDLAVARVKTRAAAGGHDVQEEMVRKKWADALSSANKAITRADTVAFYENSTETGPREMAVFYQSRLVRMANVPAERLALMPNVKLAMSLPMGTVIQDIHSGKKKPG